MSVAEIKKEIKELQPSEIDEVAAFILQIRRANDPERKEELSKLIDGDDWVEWNKSA